MKIFVTGATGYIGSAIVTRLQAAGHDVVGMVRSDESAKKLANQNAQTHKAELSDAASIEVAVRAADGVIHTASTGDANSAQNDKIAVNAILTALAGTNKPFVWTGGVWEYGDSGLTMIEENSPINPTSLVAWRSEVGQQILEAASQGIRSSIIKPGMVYGKGAGIINALFIQPARQYGVVSYIGDGNYHWTGVDVNDLADLYVLALEKAPAGSVYLGVDGKPVRVKEIAEAVARVLGMPGKVRSWPLDEARQAMGPFADALVLDQKATGAKAMRELGWQPKAPSILEEIENGSYKS